MNDIKPWWQSKIIITQAVAAFFALLGAFNLLPAAIDQEQVVAAAMGAIAVITFVMRLFSKHELTKPKIGAGGGNAAALAFALPLAAVMMSGTLGACASMPRPSPAAIERASAAFDRLQASAAVVIPLLPPEQQDRARAILASIGMAIEAARTASTLAAQDAAIASASNQLPQLSAALAR